MVIFYHKISVKSTAYSISDIKFERVAFYGFPLDCFVSTKGNIIPKFGDRDNLFYFPERHFYITS